MGQKGDNAAEADVQFNFPFGGFSAGATWDRMAQFGQKQTPTDIGMKTLQRIWELEVWSPPGYQLHPEYGKTVLAPEMWSAGIPRDVFLGLSEVPGTIDCHNLQIDLDSGALTKDAFIKFCLSRGLTDSMNDELSAARFLEFEYGRKLAWVHIPDNEAALDVAKAINQMLAIHGFLLLDGSTENPSLTKRLELPLWAADDEVESAPPNDRFKPDQLGNNAAEADISRTRG